MQSAGETQCHDAARPEDVVAWLMDPGMRSRVRARSESSAEETRSHDAAWPGDVVAWTQADASVEELPDLWVERIESCDEWLRETTRTKRREAKRSHCGHCPRWLVSKKSRQSHATKSRVTLQVNDAVRSVRVDGAVSRWSSTAR